MLVTQLLLVCTESLNANDGSTSAIVSVDSKYVDTLTARGCQRGRSTRSTIIHTIIISAVTAGTQTLYRPVMDCMRCTIIDYASD